jgi:hypothetical protein
VDWQQPVALGIVALTAGIFLWRRFRPRRFSLAHDTHCGCSAPSGMTPPGLIIQGKRGEQAQVRFTPSTPVREGTAKPVSDAPKGSFHS